MVTGNPANVNVGGSAFSVQGGYVSLTSCMVTGNKAWYWNWNNGGGGAFSVQGGYVFANKLHGPTHNTVHCRDPECRSTFWRCVSC